MQDQPATLPNGERLLVAVAATLGFLAVALGAFGAHALEGRLNPDQQGWFDTASHYLLVHAVAALVCAALRARIGRGCVVAGWLLCTGIVIFSASLYALAFGAPRIMGAVTPVGGVMLLAGWVTLGWSALRRPGP